MLDTVIRNALVFDGQDRPPQRRSVGIRDGRITHVADTLDVPARETIDGTGLWLAPGFIDIHTHYDLEVEVAPGLTESLRHGVTTVLMGNCSLSVACGAPADLADIFQRVETLPIELIRPWLARAVGWATPAQYLDHLDNLPLGPNVAVLLGHSAVRVAVMGLARSLAGPATAEEIAAMRRLTDAALDAGFCGFSVDMVHWHKVHGEWAGRALPSHHADYAEYAALAAACRERDAVFQVTPNPESRRSVWHILKLGWGGPWRPPLRMTLLSALDLDTAPWLWRLYRPLLWAYNRLAGNNLRMQTLTDAFTIYADGPITPLFEEFASGVALNNIREPAGRRALWASPGFRQRFAADWQQPGVKTFHRDFARIRVVDAPDAGWVGRTVADIATTQGKPPIDTFMDALADHDEAFRWVASGANNRDTVRRRLMAQPYVLPGFTDAGAHGRNLAYLDGGLSLLRQAVQTGFMSPQRAIHRLTGEPAAWLNLDAGRIAVGARADLVLLAPQALHGPSPAPVALADPVLGGATRLVNRDPATAVRRVLVNGLTRVVDGEPLPQAGRERAGRLLRPRSPVHGLTAVRRRYRDRIDDLHYDHGLSAYWDIFVMKHQHPMNVRLHAVAVVIMLGAAVLALATLNPWWLLGVPASNLLGQFGHARFEPSHVDARDALFSWRAMGALIRLAWLTATGRYAAELARVRALVAA